MTSSIPPSEPNDIRSLRKGVDVLRLLNGRGTVSAMDVVRSLQLSRASAYRVLTMLELLGYVRSLRESGVTRYALTIRVRGLSDGFDGEVRLLDVARPLMVAHTERHGFPLALSTPAGDRCLIRFNTDNATYRVIKRYRAGFFAPAVSSAGGLLCLASQSPTLREAVIERLSQMKLAHYAPAWDADSLRAQLQRILRDDCATFHPIGEREASVAVPLRCSGVFLAALVLRFMRVTPELGPKITLLRSLAGEIEARLG
jgi:IclR family mhp operon transcriptional activator